ncbi:hypothetical protein MBLNU230_g7287t1 [Neophaeotheca triangularis]
MKLTTISAGLSAGLTTVVAAPQARTRAVPQNANFDDIPNVNPVLGFAPPDGYKLQVPKPTISPCHSILTIPSLSYTAFGLGQPVPNTLTIQPSSRDNAVFAPYILTDPLATPEIYVDYPGSQTVSFDMRSIASGCYAATQNGALAPAISCTIRYTGTKRDGSEVTHDFRYRVQKVNLLGIALSAEKVQKTTFPSSFRDLVSLRPEVVGKDLLGVDLAQMAFDDVVYVAHVTK